MVKVGEIININSPKDANKYKIGMVHQHFKLVEVFSVIDNIILGQEDTKYGFLSKKEARERIEKISNEYGLHVKLDELVEDISVGMQQRVEILKMLYRDNEILIFDEPTAVLTPQEIEELLKIMKALVLSGKSILFITHKINEILAIADRCTVLRKGKCIGTVNVKETNKDKLCEMMVGRKVEFVADKKNKKPGENILEVQNLVQVIEMIQYHKSEINKIKNQLINEMKDKKALLRIVRSPEGEISLDLTGKKNGRGAYVCPCEACITKAVKEKRVERALEKAVSEEVYQKLLEDFKDGKQ